MNKTHRIVWSESRQTYIVAHEKVAARGKPSSTRSAVAQAVTAALLALSAGGALAAEACGGATNNITGTANATDTCTLSNSQSVTVAAGGQIENVEILGGVSAGAVVNGGTILAVGHDGILVGSSTLSSGIVNTGYIHGNGTAINITNGTVTGGIRNTGTLQGSGGSGYGVWIGTGSLDYLVNDSTSIIAGDYAGIYLNSGSTLASITNSGTISGGSSGGAIHVGTGGSSIGSLVIDGNNTAKFIGEVYALNTPVTVANNATYTMDNGQLFTLNGTSTGFTVSGTLGVAAGATGTIAGNYTQTNGTFRTYATSDSNYGKLSVTGNATGNVNGSKLSVRVTPDHALVAGSTLTGVITAGTMTSWPAAFSVNANNIDDNSVKFDFVGTVNGNSLDVVAVAGTHYCGPTVSGAVTGPCEIGNDAPSITVASGGTISNGNHGIKAIYEAAYITVANGGTVSGSTNGIYIQGVTLSGDIINHGKVISFGGTSAGGIYADGATLQGNITNHGTISTAFGSSSYQGGIALNRTTMSGAIINEGLIQVDNNLGGTAGGGINIFGASNLLGGIANNGTIEMLNGGAADSAGIWVSEARVSGGIANTGTISGALYGMGFRYGTIAGGIHNSGTSTISGSSVGINIASSSTITDGLTNSGTIRGGDYAIYVSNNSSIDSITNSGLLDGKVELNGSTLNLNGTTARVTGAVTGMAGATVYVNGIFTSENTFLVGHFEINSGGVFNMKHNVTIGSPATFVNGGVLSVAAGDTVTIVNGPYEQTANGVFRTSANSATYGKLTVSGTAGLPASAKFDVVTGDAATCGGISAGTTLAGIIASDGTLTSSSFATVTDDCTNVDFTAVKNGNAIDLVAVVVTGTPPSTPPSAPPSAPPSPPSGPIPNSGGQPFLPGISTQPTVLDLSGGNGPAMTNCLMVTLGQILGGNPVYQGQTTDGGARIAWNGQIIVFYPLSASTGRNQGAGVNLQNANPLNVATGCGDFGTSPAMYDLSGIGALLRSMGLDANINAQGVITVWVNGTYYVVRPDYLVTPGTPGTPNLVMGEDGLFHYTDSNGNSQTLHPAFLDTETLQNQLTFALGGGTMLIQTDGTALLTYGGHQYVLIPDMTLSTVPPGHGMDYWWQDSENHYSVRINVSPYYNFSQGFTARRVN